MFVHNLQLAVRSLRRNPVLTTLMVLAIGLGIGTSITTLTVMHLLSGNPIPSRSGVLYYPQIDPRDKTAEKPGKKTPDQMAYTDAMNLLAAHRADRQAAMVSGTVAIRPDNALKAFYTDARYTSSDFFPMFAVPFIAGSGWTPADDEAKARVVVISESLRQKLFAGNNAIGQTLRLAKSDFRIVGVIKDWRPVPFFFDVTSHGSFAHAEDVFVPLSTALDVKLDIEGSIQCWGQSFDASDLQTAPCTWLQFWVELNSPAKASAYKQFLTQYSEEQKSLGRFELPPDVHLRSLLDWLDYKKVVPSDVRLQTWLAFGFLIVCLVNTIGLLLAKFLRRAPEIGVRRALGASKRAVFGQFLVEAGVIGTAGGIVGLLLALFGLWTVRQQPAAYADLAHLDAPMFLLTFVLAVLSSLLAGVLPAWRACGVPPALQLKSS